MSLKKIKRELFKNPKVKEYYDDKSDLAFEIGRMMFKARMEKGITQKEFAKIMGVKQSFISRIESGGVNFRISTMVKYLNALKIKPKIINIDGDSFKNN